MFDVIRDAGQVPHLVYGQGMSRLSCVFCIMASRADLATAAQLQPELYGHYCALSAGSATRCRPPASRSRKSPASPRAKATPARDRKLPDLALQQLPATAMTDRADAARRRSRAGEGAGGGTVREDRLRRQGPPGFRLRQAPDPPLAEGRRDHRPSLHRDPAGSRIADPVPGQAERQRRRRAGARPRRSAATRRSCGLGWRDSLLKGPWPFRFLPDWAGASRVGPFFLPSVRRPLRDPRSARSRRYRPTLRRRLAPYGRGRPGSRFALRPAASPCRVLADARHGSADRPASDGHR